MEQIIKSPEQRQQEQQDYAKQQAANEAARVSLIMDVADRLGVPVINGGLDLVVMVSRLINRLEDAERAIVKLVTLLPQEEGDE